eukprot:COSAG06_NODE_1980_length_7926_cov_10.286061_5_plen_51_part_00
MSAPPFQVLRQHRVTVRLVAPTPAYKFFKMTLTMRSFWPPDGLVEQREDA